MQLSELCLSLEEGASVLVWEKAVKVKVTLITWEGLVDISA